MTRRATSRSRTTGASEEATGFLNVDLDIVAARDLLPLVHALAPNVFDLYTGRVGGRYETHLELAARGPRQPKNAQATIDRFVNLLAGLPPRARRMWNNAIRRDFNIGIQGGTSPRAFELALEPATLKAVARLRARIVVTVYAVDTMYPRKPRRRGTRRR